MSVQPPHDLACERITRMRRRYQTQTPQISIERARLFTSKWRERDSPDVQPGLRVAESMLHVYRNMTHNIDPDDRIAGNWTEHFLGLPLDIERGLFNNILACELTRPAMLRFQLGSTVRLLGYLVRQNGIRGLVRTFKFNASLGGNPLNVGLDTLERREINRFEISPENSRELRRDLLPYWKGRTIADAVDRELRNSGLVNDEVADFVRSLVATPTKQALIVSTSASIATYQGHLILDYATVLERGLLQMRREASAQLESVSNGDSERRVFLQSLLSAFDGLICFCERLVQQLEHNLQACTDPERREVLRTMLKAARRSPLHPARGFREAVQGLWSTHTAVELANITNVHAPGRLDQMLIPYFRRDLENGDITHEQASELCQELMLKIMTHNLRPESNILGKFYLRYEGSTPITVGGQTSDGQDATNELTYLLLEAADRSKTITSIVLRVHRDTPNQLYLAAAELMHNSCSNLSLMNDEVFVDAMRSRGFSDPDALDYAITGCTDLICPGKSGGISFSGLLLSRVFDAALRNGDAMTLIGPVRGVGPQTGDPSSFENIEQLLKAFEIQLDHAVMLNAESSNLRDRIFSEHLPAPHISALMQGCLENGRDITRGGATYNFSGINMINSVANVIDSLYTINKLVFERHDLTLPELLTAIDANFVGHERVAQLVDGLEGKWGNGEAQSDELAARVAAMIFASTDKYRDFRGGPFVPFINSMTSHTIDGRASMATIDGRRAATPYASSCNPYNVERAGTTAVLRSVAAIDFSGLLGCAVNLKLHPSAIGQSTETRDKFCSLLRSYFAMGGAQLQPTVASAEMLRAAQHDPETFRDVIVKVGGYSTYFVDLGREIQDEVISRTEHCAVC
ncbi:MAG: pyruvate formate lyase family protein [Candidatus Alcyoniella australis]|nr:pyruvate formate lyase family protein [Candidatus Alcyoniella australis]